MISGRHAIIRAFDSPENSNLGTCNLTNYWTQDIYLALTPQLSFLPVWIIAAVINTLVSFVIFISRYKITLDFSELFTLLALTSTLMCYKIIYQITFSSYSKLKPFASDIIWIFIHMILQITYRKIILIGHIVLSMNLICLSSRSLWHFQLPRFYSRARVNGIVILSILSGAIFARNGKITVCHEETLLYAFVTFKNDNGIFRTLNILFVYQFLLIIVNTICLVYYTVVYFIQLRGKHIKLVSMDKREFNKLYMIQMELFHYCAAINVMQYLFFLPELVISFYRVNNGNMKLVFTTLHVSADIFLAITPTVALVTLSHVRKFSVRLITCKVNFLVSKK